MESKLKPYENSGSSRRLILFFVAALAVYGVLGFYSHSISAMAEPSFRALPIARFPELIGLAFLVPVIFSMRKSGRPHEILAHQDAIRDLNDLPDDSFHDKIIETFQRMGYTLLVPDHPEPQAGHTFKIINNSQVTLVLVKRDKLFGAADVLSFMENLFTEGAERGMLITTGLFTRSALKHAMTAPMILIDGIALLSILSKHRSTCCGGADLSDVTDAAPSLVESPPFFMEASPECPACGSDMHLTLPKSMNGHRGAHWACSGRPRCAMTLSYELCP